MTDDFTSAQNGPVEHAAEDAAAGNGHAAGIRQWLEAIQQGSASVEEAMQALRHLPFEDLGFARLDHHRGLRTGFSEVIFCEGKTPAEVATLVERAVAWQGQVLGTRADRTHYEAAAQQVSALQYDARARLLWLDATAPDAKLGGAMVVAAGTSDLPVAEEAARTLELMGQAPQRLTDVGVAGLHRFLPHLEQLQQANVIVAVAGMEGALPSVIAGLVSAPVIAVPTSVGYGASFQGLAALLGMLSSCAAGISVVNIDNGFGAGYNAATINRLAHQHPV